MNHLNGWQRLWLVLTCVTLVGGVWFSGYIALGTNRGEPTRGYNEALEAEVNDPRCASFLTTPVNEMKEPGLSSPCWYIYNTRYFDREAPLPYSMARRLSQQTLQAWKEFAVSLAILIPVILLGSVLVYLAGWLVAWIRRGFQSA